MHRSLIAALAAAAVSQAAWSQSVLFNFDNAPVHTSLPIDVTVDGVTAHLWAVEWYYNYSIQRADTLGVTPVGFSGLCVYPNSVYPCDLHISFDHLVDACSILYAVDDLYCDAAATMRLTAYLGGVQVGTITHTGSFDAFWPTSTISIAPGQPFDTVVLHHQAGPPGCSDWGRIFMADNLEITLAQILCRADMNGDGSLDFFDVQAFLQTFAAGGSEADFNSDGLYDFFDVQLFLQEFSAGCP